MKSADEWLIYTYEAIHSSPIPAQSYVADWDKEHGGIPQASKLDIRLGQTDIGVTKDYDLKKRYMWFVRDHGLDARVYIANCLGFSIRRLAVELPNTFIGSDVPDTEWKVRQAIERGRSEWGNILRSIGIRSSWENNENE